MNCFTLAVRLFPFIVGAIHAVESLCSAKSGREKQDAAVEAVRAMLSVLETGADRKLLDDGQVDVAVRAVIDSYVGLHNIIARKTTTTPASS